MSYLLLDFTSWLSHTYPLEQLSSKIERSRNNFAPYYLNIYLLVAFSQKTTTHKSQIEVQNCQINIQFLLLTNFRFLWGGGQVPPGPFFVAPTHISELQIPLCWLNSLNKQKLMNVKLSVILIKFLNRILSPFMK